MKRLIIIGFILFFACIVSFGQKETSTVYFGVVTPVSFLEPEYKYFVGDIKKEQWNIGYSFAYSSFAEKDSLSKFVFGAYFSVSYSKLRSVELDLDTATEFNYYGVATVQGDYTITNTTVTGEAFNGDLVILELQPSMRWYPTANNDIFVQTGVNFSLINRNVRDKIHNFVDENTKYVQSDLNVGISVGGGYNYKMFTFAPSYKFIFTNGMFHYGSIMIGINF